MGLRVKMVRDAAAWAMEQSLLDDMGFEDVTAAYEKGDDLTRESVIKALGIRGDAVMTQPRFDKQRLTRLLDRALNDDPLKTGIRAEGSICPLTAATRSSGVGFWISRVCSKALEQRSARGRGPPQNV